MRQITNIINVNTMPLYIIKFNVNLMNPKIQKSNKLKGGLLHPRALIAEEIDYLLTEKEIDYLILHQKFTHQELDK